MPVVPQVDVQVFCRARCEHSQVDQHDEHDCDGGKRGRPGDRGKRWPADVHYRIRKPAPRNDGIDDRADLRHEKIEHDEDAGESCGNADCGAQGVGMFHARNSCENQHEYG